MSIKLMGQVWDIDDEELKDARLLTLLSLADHANDEGQCWPSIPRLAKRARVSERQVQRVLQWLMDAGYVDVMEKGNGRGNVTLYQVILKGDAMSPIDAAKDAIVSPYNAIKDDAMTPIKTKRVTLAQQKGDIGDIKGDIGEANYSHARIEPSLEPIQEPTTEKEGDAANAAPPAGEAWNEFLVAFCWTCHGHKDLSALTEKQKGILTSEAKRIHGKGYTIDDLRNWFRDKWQKDWRWTKDKRHERPAPADVRSMIPSIRDVDDEQENSNYTKNGNGRYSVDIPSVVAIPASPRSMPPLPPPMAHADPWAVALDELARTLPPRAVELLEGSRLVANGELAGVPFYQVVVVARQDSADWLKRQVEPAIRKKVASVVGHRVEIDIVAAQGEPA